MKARSEVEVLTTWSPIFSKNLLLELLNIGARGVRFIAKGFSPEQLRQNVENLLHEVATHGSNFHLMIDLPGAKPRLTRNINSYEVRKDDVLIFTGNSDSDVEAEAIPVEFLEYYIPSIHKGHRVLIADGTICFIVESTQSGYLVCRATSDCTLVGGRSLNLPDSNVEYKPFTALDLASLKALVGIPLGSISISMVSSAPDVVNVRSKVRELGFTCPLISKIETKQGIKNINEIAELSDKIMVARGDLSIESPLESLGALQAYIIQVARSLDKDVIVATGILSSLATAQSPSIAEISELGLFFAQGIRSFLLGDVVAPASSPLASQWLIKTYNEWRTFEGRESMVTPKDIT